MKSIIRHIFKSTLLFEDEYFIKTVVRDEVTILSNRADVTKRTLVDCYPLTPGRTGDMMELVETATWWLKCSHDIVSSCCQCDYERRPNEFLSLTTSRIIDAVNAPGRSSRMCPWTVELSCMAPAVWKRLCLWAAIMTNTTKLRYKRVEIKHHYRRRRQQKKTKKWQHRRD